MLRGFFHGFRDAMMPALGRRIAIIGGGFSGSLLAVQLLRSTSPADRILLIERNAAFGRGVAYATGNDSHLLNVRAGNMSAFSSQPDHFLEWLQRQPESSGMVTTPDRLTFVSRRLYGTYIQEILASEIAGQSGAPRLGLVADEAVALHDMGSGYRIEVAGGRQYDADIVALAIGNFPPASNEPGFIANPWDPQALLDIDRESGVLLVGTGLTMIDTVISLLDQEHTGPILAISRRGLLPRTHAAVAAIKPILPAAVAPRTVRGLIGRVRQETGRAAAEGRDWRAVIDSLRPDTRDIWRNLPVAEKRRFLRHVRPWWDVHRHRMAPSVAARIEAARSSGQLSIQRARLGRLTGKGSLVDAELLPVFGAPALHIEVARVINCAGPLGQVHEIPSPLIRRLLDEGVLRADQLGIGLDVTGDGATIDRDNRVNRRLYAVGPITRGVFWEATAVPDIRLHCEALARHVAEMAPAD
jgi:uncharacterized NAD(P)/FAD-binding protein YdhS